MPIECAQGDQPLRCPNRVFWVNEPSAVPWWWCGDLFWCGWLQGAMKYCGWLWGDVRWGNVVSCEMSCHVMWCNLMCLHFMWCDFLCCVMLRNALRCHVMSSHVMSCHLLWSDAVQWDEILWVCDALWLVAMSRCVVRNGCVGWIGRWSGDPNYTDLLRTTQYYKVLLRYYSVLHSTTPVLLCTTKYYSSTNSVLQSTTPVLFCTRKYYSSTTPVLLCTTKYYSSTTLYYKILLQYYSVLQSTTPVLRCTTKYYSSAILYYKVLLQYYSVLQSTTPVPLCTTKYYSSTSLYYKVLLQYYSVLQSTTPVLLCTTKYYSSTSLYYKVLLQYYSVLQSTTPVLQSTHLQGAKHQRHQMLCLPRKVTLMIDPRHIWNVIYNAQSNRTHPPTSPNTAPATQNDSHEWCPSHMKRHLQCAEQQVSSTNVTKYCACHEKWLASLILVTRETSFTMRGTTGITLQPHQMLCLPRKMTLMIDVRHTWHVIYNARSNKHHPPTSPNAAPATKNDAHHWLSSHMKRHLQCAEEQASPANLTKYCACHAKWLSWLIFVTYETSFTMRGATGITLQPHQILRLPRKSALQNLSEILRERLKRQFQCAADSTMIRTWSDHELVISRPPVRRGYFALRLSTQISPNTAPATKSDTPRSPNTAPATKNDSHDRYPWHMKRHLQCAEQQASPSNLTKYCACHGKRISSLILVTYETSFTMRGATSITLQPHQILRLPLKMILMIDIRDIWNVIYNARSNKHHPPTSPNTAPATEKESHLWSSSHMKRHLQCAEQQASPSNLTKYCACH